MINLHGTRFSTCAVDVLARAETAKLRKFDVVQHCAERVKAEFDDISAQLTRTKEALKACVQATGHDLDGNGRDNEWLVTHGANEVRECAKERDDNLEDAERTKKMLALAEAGLRILNDDPESFAAHTLAEINKMKEE